MKKLFNAKNDVSYGDLNQPHNQMDLPRYLLLGIALVSMAGSGPMIRFTSASALSIVVWRVWFAWPVLCTMAVIRGDRWPLIRGSIAGIFLAAHWVTWVLAVQSTSIASASLLIDTGALWSALLSRRLLNETIPRRQWLGLGLALLGVVIIVTAKSSAHHSVTGDLLALLGSFAWVGYTFVGRKARQTTGFWGYTATVYFSASLLVSSAAWLAKVPLWHFNTQTWIVFALLAFFPTLLGHGSFNYLLRYIGPARLSLWTLVEPILATLIAWPLFNEIPQPQMLLGGAITLLGIGLGFTNEYKLKEPKVSGL